MDSKGAVGGRRVGGGQQAWWFRERESSLSFLLCTALWQEMIGSAVQSEYRSYAKFITKTGCNSVSSCKDRVTGGLDEAWNVVYDTMQSLVEFGIVAGNKYVSTVFVRTAFVMFPCAVGSIVR